MLGMRGSSRALPTTAAAAGDGFEIGQGSSVSVGKIEALDVDEGDGRDEFVGLPRARLFGVQLVDLLEGQALPFSIISSLGELCGEGGKKGGKRVREGLTFVS